MRTLPATRSQQGWVPFPGFFAAVGYSVACLIAFSALLEAIAGAWDRRHGERSGDLPFADSPAFSNQPWAAGYLADERRRRREQHGSYVPFRLWGVAPWNSPSINTVETPLGRVRATVDPDAASCVGRPKSKVWVFGGSTMYGSGVPDWATVPSRLSHALHAPAGRCMEVMNLGSEGYNTNQELLLFIEELKAGHTPDVAVFYDGVNDTLAGAINPGIPSAHQDYENIKSRIEGTATDSLTWLRQSHVVTVTRAWWWTVAGRRDAGPVSTDAELAAKADAVLENYRANIRVLRTLAAERRVRTYFFWQPAMFYGGKVLDPFEQRLVRERERTSGAEFARNFRAVYARAEEVARASGEFHFLGHMFDDVRDSLYLDTWMHLGPQGNELVARNISAVLRADEEASP